VPSPAWHSPRTAHHPTHTVATAQVGQCTSQCLPLLLPASESSLPITEEMQRLSNTSMQHPPPPPPQGKPILEGGIHIILLRRTQPGRKGRRRIKHDQLFSPIQRTVPSLLERQGGQQWQPHLLPWPCTPSHTPAPGTFGVAPATTACALKRLTRLPALDTAVAFRWRACLGAARFCVASPVVGRRARREDAQEFFTCLPRYAAYATR